MITLIVNTGLILQEIFFTTSTGYSDQLFYGDNQDNKLLLTTMSKLKCSFSLHFQCKNLYTHPF